MNYHDYVMYLSMMVSWFNYHVNDTPKYYEFTMRHLITDYTYNELINKKELSTNLENNIIRLIEDNKIFVREHLEKIGVLFTQNF